MHKLINWIIKITILIVILKLLAGLPAMAALFWLVPVFIVLNEWNPLKEVN